MKATGALLLDHHVQNGVRKLAVDVHQTSRVGLAGSQRPPHVSLTHPFSIPELAASEASVDQLVRSIEPGVLTFPRIAGPGNAPVLWLDVEETAT